MPDFHTYSDTSSGKSEDPFIKLKDQFNIYTLQIYKKCMLIFVSLH